MRNPFASRLGRSGLLRLGRWLSRSEWTSRLLNLSRAEGTGNEPGLVMIQIDGLSRREFQQALEQGSLPFLSRLCTREHYVTHPHYSGLPSNTPAVQGELFYGVKGGVPAFSFVDRDTRQVVKMYEVGAAAAIEQRLRRQGVPLLEGGSAFLRRETRVGRRAAGRQSRAVALLDHAALRRVRMGGIAHAA